MHLQLIVPTAPPPTVQHSIEQPPHLHQRYLSCGVTTRDSGGGGSEVEERERWEGEVGGRGVRERWEGEVKKRRGERG